MSRKRSPISRVLFAIPNLHGGGAEKIAAEIAAGLPRDRFEPKLFVHERWGSLVGTVEDRVQTIFGNEGEYNRRQLPGLFSKTLSLVRDADIVIGANEGRATLLSLVASRIYQKPFVAWLHNNWQEFSKVVSWRQRFSLRQYNKADIVVAASDGVGEAFSRLVRLDLAKIRTIYNAVSGQNIVALAAQALPDHVSRIFEGPTILAVGRLDHQKNHELLIQSHALLRARGLPQQLVILGEGPFHDRLLALAKELNVEGSVHLLGFQKNPYAFMSRATVFALSSRFEGFSLVIAEALFAGVPVVSVDCPSGPAELLGGGSYGILVKRDDPAELAQALQRVLVDERERARLAKAARDRSHDFDLPVAIGHWAAMLDSLVAPHKY